MEPRIEKLSKKRLVGISKTMSVMDDKTGQLWGQFGPRIQEIPNRISHDKISMQVYPATYFDFFNPKAEFEKWATVEVKDLNSVPKGMKTFILEEGFYAVFDYKGSSADNSIFQYIFSEWLPNSNYVLEDGPHFEVIGPNYRNNDPESEEEIWIPIRPISKT